MAFPGSGHSGPGVDKPADAGFSTPGLTTGVVQGCVSWWHPVAGNGCMVATFVAPGKHCGCPAWNAAAFAGFNTVVSTRYLRILKKPQTGADFVVFLAIGRNNRTQHGQFPE